MGFENHGGRTEIGEHTPFGKVTYGFGNTGKSGYEGVVYKNVIATYLHGPLLPKNPHVCDYLLERALKRKYGEDAVLEPLPDEMEKKANDYIVERYNDKKIYSERNDQTSHLMLSSSFSPGTARERKSCLHDFFSGLLHELNCRWYFGKGGGAMGRTYVMSDIHGMAELFKRMLEQIRFSDEDTLYILGRYDRQRAGSAGILDFDMSHENVTALRGNHEDGFAQWYDNVEDKVHQRYYYIRMMC